MDKLDSRAALEAAARIVHSKPLGSEDARILQLMDSAARMTWRLSELAHALKLSFLTTRRRLEALKRLGLVEQAADLNGGEHGFAITQEGGEAVAALRVTAPRLALGYGHAAASCSRREPPLPVRPPATACWAGSAKPQSSEL